MKTITRSSVMNFWIRVIEKDPSIYIDCDEFNTTAMGEQAAYYFDCMTDDGQSDIERDIFDWAVQFAEAHVVSEFIFQ